jgi:hypothetical protein
LHLLVFVNKPEKGARYYSTDKQRKIGVEMDCDLEIGGDNDRCKDKAESQNKLGVYIDLIHDRSSFCREGGKPLLYHLDFS